MRPVYVFAENIEHDRRAKLVAGLAEPRPQTARIACSNWDVTQASRV